MSEITLGSRLCESFYEWHDTDGTVSISAKCQLPFAHKGEHFGRSGQWARKAEENRLVTEVHRLRDQFDAIYALIDALESSGSLMGKFFAQEIRNRITGG